MSRKSRFINISGMRFGKWRVLSLFKMRYPSRMSLWNCVCDCGNEKVVIQRTMMEGRSNSCGCNLVSAVTKHGMSSRINNNGGHHPIYNSWHAMKQRCLNKKCKEYRHYGGRGIKICNRWAESFSAFMDDMSSSWRNGLSLNRIDNDGDYCPKNCNWATPTEQHGNTRKSIFITRNGETKCLRRWCMELGIRYDTVWGRYSRGWKPEELFNAP